MLQRFQTLWLFLSGISASLGMKYPFYSGTLASDNAYHEINGLSTVPLAIFTAATALLSFLTIFLYKDRKLQLRMCVGILILEVILIILYQSQENKFASGTYSLTAVIQGLVLLFAFLAIRGISRDQKIVKDSDRLR